MSHLFTSAIKSLEETIIHLEKYDKDRDINELRFIIINLDGAVELLLKETLQRQNKSIYSKDRSLALPLIIEHLKKQPIIKINQIRTLHEIRNNIQHLGLLPNESQAIEIIFPVLDFCYSFLTNEFNFEVKSLNNYLSKKGLEVKSHNIYLREANIAYKTGNLRTAFLLRYRVLGHEIKALAKKNRISLSDNETGIGLELLDIVTILGNKGLIDEKTTDEIFNISNTANSFLVFTQEEHNIEDKHWVTTEYNDLEKCIIKLKDLNNES